MKMGDITGSALLVTPEALKIQCTAMYNNFVEEKIFYAEVRCSPQNYALKGATSSWEVLKTIIETFNELTEQSIKNNLPYCQVNIIIIATRKTTGDLSAISRHIALAITAWDHYGIPMQNENEQNFYTTVCGIDLAGLEAKESRPEFFVTDFYGAHRTGVYITTHAGENDDEESVWQSINLLNTNRIGHGLNMANNSELLRMVRHRGIGVELCPAANTQIVGFNIYNHNQKYNTYIEELKTNEINNKKKPDYPLKEYLDHGIKATVNTDNIGISNHTLTENYELVAKHLNPTLTYLDLFKLLRNSIDVAFIERRQRINLIERIEKNLEIWLKKFNNALAKNG